MNASSILKSKTYSWIGIFRRPSWVFRGSTCHVRGRCPFFSPRMRSPRKCIWRLFRATRPGKSCLTTTRSSNHKVSMKKVTNTGYYILERVPYRSSACCAVWSGAVVSLFVFHPFVFTLIVRVRVASFFSSTKRITFSNVARVSSLLACGSYYSSSWLPIVWCWDG